MHKPILKYAAIVVLFAPLVLVAQVTNERPAGNPEITRMLRADLPESTILSEIEILAARGSTFDISPAALTELKQSGASEKVLNSVIWAEMTIVPSVDIPKPRGVFYRAGSNLTPLGSFMLWDEMRPRWATWPFYSEGGKNVALAASPSLVQVSDGNPTLVVQGFAGDSSWQLVKIGRASDHREIHLKRKHAFSHDFFSDSVFERDQLRPLTLAAAGDTYTVRPAAPLESGTYALCSQLPNGGWLRTCYEFQVSGI